MFHLGWFLGAGFGIQPWRVGAHGPWAGTNVRDWMKPDLYIDLAQSLERAGFDYLLIEDTSMIEDSFGDSMEVTLREGLFAPKNDPMPLVPLLTGQTKHIGIFPTVSTIQYPPYLAARLFATLDHLTEGRVGMNVVTSVTDRVAQNFGFDRHLDHDERYRMADEWVDVVRRLQRSWEPDAVVADEVGGVYADHTKVHPIHFRGKYFASRGPLNTIPGPQYTTPMASAGSSGPGRDLAARNGDTMVCMVKSVEDMKAYRKDMVRRLEENGRDPGSLKLLFLAVPTVEATDEQARAAHAAKAAARRAPAAVELNLWNMTYVSGGRIDFSKFDLDIPVSEIDLTQGNGERSSLANIFQHSEGKTLREIAATSSQMNDLGLVGSPDTVASMMDEMMQEVGGDGFLLYAPTTRRDVIAITDGLAPVLRRRGLIRDGYEHATLRENLMAF